MGQNLILCIKYKEHCIKRNTKPPANYYIPCYGKCSFSNYYDAVLHKSFTVRLGILSDTLRNVDNEEDLVEIKNIRGDDEIGSLMTSYNKMAERINILIKI